MTFVLYVRRFRDSLQIAVFETVFSSSDDVDYRRATAYTGLRRKLYYRKDDRAMRLIYELSLIHI